ncbi:uncharacterized protein I303_102332 [Kwoniella dejecticola CBS 10117]|uniref:Uncharacterized protein n=1 Tax=Kwoniella dejecticola CBS 10117 TaxID=1296121 RepID=A0A1A6AB91_9TREE|nr:uncharacterized protein I303_01527 [Kwoniella dejecticola CBS 10117]OBR87325.1 hypothetical protein I303_01527 [Kwoniella dejecticola CBS 10117]
MERYDIATRILLRSHEDIPNGSSSSSKPDSDPDYPSPCDSGRRGVDHADRLSSIKQDLKTKNDRLDSLRSTIKNMGRDTSSPSTSQSQTKSSASASFSRSSLSASLKSVFFRSNANHPKSNSERLAELESYQTEILRLRHESKGLSDEYRLLNSGLRQYSEYLVDQSLQAVHDEIYTSLVEARQASIISNIRDSDKSKTGDIVTDTAGVENEVEDLLCREIRQSYKEAMEETVGPALRGILDEALVYQYGDLVEAGDAQDSVTATEILSLTESIEMCKPVYIVRRVENDTRSAVDIFPSCCEQMEDFDQTEISFRDEPMSDTGLIRQLQDQGLNAKGWKEISSHSRDAPLRDRPIRSASKGGRAA